MCVSRGGCWSCRRPDTAGRGAEAHAGSRPGSWCTLAVSDKRGVAAKPFPGCEQRRFLDAHHRKHWAEGGETTLDNLLLLCRHHHRLVHEGGYTVDAQGRFYYPCGAEILQVPRLPRGDPERLIAANSPEIDEHSYQLSGSESFDLDYAVLALATIERHTATSHGDPV
jgi:HNH endonuclease